MDDDSQVGTPEGTMGVQKFAESDQSISTGGWAVMTESKEQVIEAEVELGGGNGGVEGANGLVGDDDGLGGV